MEMGTAESRYDKISDFHTECQGLFGHLLCAVQLSGLSQTHAHQHAHIISGNMALWSKHTALYLKKKSNQKEQVVMYDASWIHFVLISMDDWLIIANETSC